MAVEEREDVKPESGERKYGDVEYADETNKKYPIDNEEHIRAAWSYINHPHNASKYDSASLATIKGKIKSAGAKHGIHFEKSGYKE